MALKAYEDACMRAELFGQPKPNKEEFLEKNKHLDVVEFEEVDIRTAENTAVLNDDLKEVGGGLAELNTILESTQTKLNRLKGVCGTMTNFFRIKLASKGLSYSSDQSYIGQTNFDADAVNTSDLGSVNTGLGPADNELTMRTEKQNGGDINSALSDLEQMQENENSIFMKKEQNKQVNTQINKLDNLILQADRAEQSLKSQNKQMRNFLR